MGKLSDKEIFDIHNKHEEAKSLLSDLYYSQIPLSSDDLMRINTVLDFIPSLIEKISCLEVELSDKEDELEKSEDEISEAEGEMAEIKDEFNWLTNKVEFLERRLSKMCELCKYKNTSVCVFCNGESFLWFD